MTDEQFIFILKAKLKEYYHNGRSVGLELRKLVADFRQEIEDDCLNFKYEKKPKHSIKKPLKPL